MLGKDGMRVCLYTQFDISLFAEERKLYLRAGDRVYCDIPNAREKKVVN